MTVHRPTSTRCSKLVSKTGCYTEHRLCVTEKEDCYKKFNE